MGSLETSKDDEVSLPGFRFYPTDEELVGFYLRRKVEKKPTSIELIKQIEIYKYDPWDLPKVGTVGDNELYFFCKRGRKYRNSIRPNRVTGSGFWKATGIDRQIYSVEGQVRDCIGLKKSLVYYRGCAGKGTKTDWMMHEFRLPAEDKSTNLPIAKCTAQEAEVWTLCRIFKRNGQYRKYTNSKTCSVESENQQDKKPIVDHMSERNQLRVDQLSSRTQPPFMATSSSLLNPDVNELIFTYENWDELRSVVEFSVDPLPL